MDFGQRHCRAGGPLSRLCTYATEEKLFSVIAVDDESTYAEWVKNTNAYTVGLKIRRIVRVLDPSLAE